MERAYCFAVQYTTNSKAIIFYYKTTQHTMEVMT